MSYVIGIDQGTTGTFVGLMNADGELLAHTYRQHQQIHPQPEWVEHDPLELWNHVLDAVNEVITQAGVAVTDIAGIGIANQGESVVMWDASSGEALYNVIVWQDTRTQENIAPLLDDAEKAQAIQSRTGLRPDAYFSASKIKWLLTNVPSAGDLLKSGNLRCGTLDTWFIWKLTGGAAYVTDPSTASRTLLYNIHTQEWDDYLLDLFDIPRDLLAEVRQTTAFFGEIRAAESMARGVPILASLVDQPAAMVGHACLRAGQIKATYGTGCFINMNTEEHAIENARGLLTLLAWKRENRAVFGLDGGVLTAGATINWLSGKLGLLPSAQAVDDLCGTLRDNPVMWIPAQIGLGAPYWNRDIRGAWLGIGLETEPAHLVHAVLEAIALRVVQIVRAMSDAAHLEVSALRVDGGLTRSKTLMQLQADLLGCPVEVLADSEATARGVCYLAARQAGLWADDDAITAQISIARIHEPGISADAREARLTKFANAIRHIKEVI